MAEIQLYGKLARGRVAIVDDGDLALVSSYRWYVMEESRQTIHGPYAWARIIRNGRPAVLFMHTLIAGELGIGHVNDDGLDNRRKNLRPSLARLGIPTGRARG